MHITGNEAQWDVMHAKHGKRKPLWSWVLTHWVTTNLQASVIKHLMVVPHQACCVCAQPELPSNTHSHKLVTASCQSFCPIHPSFHSLTHPTPLTYHPTHLSRHSPTIPLTYHPNQPPHSPTTRATNFTAYQ